MSAPPSQRRHARSRRGEETLRQRERHTRLLVRELSHRSKNLLAIIEAMARQTHRTSRSRAEFLERFGARVASLARSHDLLVERNWAGIRLSDLLRAHLKPFVDAESERVATGGPELVLQPAAAQNLGMAFHELATNASTHGALSTPSGHIEVAWDLIDDPGGTQRFCIRWREHAGLPVVPPDRSGFGQAVLERIVPTSLGGEAHIDWQPQGCQWRLVAPQQRSLPSAPAGQLRPRHRP